MKEYLGVLQSKLRYLIIKKYISAILFGYNYLYRIYYAFKKQSRYFVVIKKEKNAKSVNNKIYAKNNINILDLQDNQ